MLETEFENEVKLVNYVQVSVNAKDYSISNEFLRTMVTIEFIKSAFYLGS